MKKLFFVLAVLGYGLSSLQAQTCRLERDSVIEGERVTTYRDYIYASGKLAEVHEKDSGSVNYTRSYALLYTGNNLTEIREINIAGGSTLETVIRYTYNGSNQITHIRVSGGADTTAWLLSHDVNYSGGNMSSLTVDSMMGGDNIKGIPADFVDITWTSGNISSFSIALGPDTIEMSLAYDNKNNVFKHLINSEGAFFLLQAGSANNIDSMWLVNNENIPGSGPAPAGTVALKNLYTYTNNEVRTLEEVPGLFAENPKKTQFNYDCGVGIGGPASATQVSIYPNPAADFIRLNNENFRGTVRVFDVAGKVVFNQLITNASTLDVRTLKPGVYYVEMTDNNQVFKGSFLKE